MTNTAIPLDSSLRHEQQQMQKPAPGARKAAMEKHGALPSQSRNIAVELERLAVGIQSARTFKAAVQSRLNFITRAIELSAVARLNALGELLPFAWLSERTLDRVFEDECMSDEVIVQLLTRIDVDAEFAEAVTTELGEQAVAIWRAEQRQGVLL